MSMLDVSGKVQVRISKRRHLQINAGEDIFEKSRFARCGTPDRTMFYLGSYTENL